MRIRCVLNRIQFSWYVNVTSSKIRAWITPEPVNGNAPDPELQTAAPHMWTQLQCVCMSLISKWYTPNWAMNCSKLGFVLYSFKPTSPQGLFTAGWRRNSLIGETVYWHQHFSAGKVLVWSWTKSGNQHKWLTFRVAFGHKLLESFQMQCFYLHPAWSIFTASQL